MNEADRAMVGRYANGSAALREAAGGLSAAQLDALPIPGTWPIRTSVVHLMHAEIFLTARIVQILAEPLPLVMNLGENAFTARPHYEAVPVDASLATIEGLRAMADADFARVGIHSQIGSERSRSRRW